MSGVGSVMSSGAGAPDRPEAITFQGGNYKITINNLSSLSVENINEVCGQLDISYEKDGVTENTIISLTSKMDFLKTGVQPQPVERQGVILRAVIASSLKTHLAVRRPLSGSVATRPMQSHVVSAEPAAADAAAEPYPEASPRPDIAEGRISRIGFRHVPAEVTNLEYRLETDERRVQRKLEKETNLARIQGEQHEKEPPSAYITTGLSLEVYKKYAPSIIQNCIRKDYQRSVSYPLRGYNREITSVKSSVENGSGIASAQGRRESMEDADISEDFTFSAGGTDHTVSISGIFDGHDGTAMSLFAKREIIEKLKNRLEEYNREEISDLGIWNALKIGFVDLSRSFVGPDGSTANIVLKIGDELWTANSGDSRSLLLDPEGNVTQLSEDAKPDDERYAKSVGSRGGAVSRDHAGTARVDGIAMPRALGDHHSNAISARPKISKFSAPEGGWGGYSLIQCCDGAFDVGINSDIGKLVKEKIAQGKREKGIPEDVSLSGHPDAGEIARNAATSVVEFSYYMNSQDNISVLIKPL